MTPTFIRSILIANRSEIAIRVMRAAAEMRIRTVAIYSQQDRQALHRFKADESYLVGEGQKPLAAYLDGDDILRIARRAGVDAIHPGYGFLSENAEFAQVVDKCGLTFIGPSPDAMRQWGDKLTGREAARKFGLPLLPGSESLESAAHAESEAKRVGLPVMVKARGGGGGRGMRVVQRLSEARRAFESASAEAMASFKNAQLYLERYVEKPRHIEFQALADQHGQVWTLGERECSLQRRHQKLVEESPSTVMTEKLRSEMAERIRRAIRETGYTSLGTLEFLMDEDKSLYFMEMNTRLQVEHPVTELVTGVDLVVEQIKAAAGLKLDLPDTRPWKFRGHAIECRVMAEDPLTFAPWPGLITEYHPPGGGGVRVDSGIYGGWTVPPHYDSLLAKVIVHAKNREQAILRMDRALDEFIIGGIRTNIDFHKRMLADVEVREGRMTTRTVERIMEQLKRERA